MLAANANLLRPLAALVLGVLLTSLSTSPAQAPKKGPPIHALPEKPPAWIDGYRVRWPLQVMGDVAKDKSETILAKIPTGGWLKPDATDLAIQAAGGQKLPLQVLSARSDRRHHHAVQAQRQRPLVLGVWHERQAASQGEDRAGAARRDGGRVARLGRRRSGQLGQGARRSGQERQRHRQRLSAEVHAKL